MAHMTAYQNPAFDKDLFINCLRGALPWFWQDIGDKLAGEIK